MKKAAFYFVMVALSLLFTEFILFALSLVFPVAPIHNIPLAIPDPRLGFRPNPDYPDHDKNGFRNENVPERIDLVALGDSQTYGAGVERAEAWPRQLQKLAGMTVYNMAFGSYGPAHGLMLLDEALQLKPTLIVQAFYSGNDLYDAYHLVYHLHNLAFLKSGDSLAIANMNRQHSLEEKIAEAFNYKDKHPWVKPLRKTKWLLYDNSRIFRLLSGAVNRLARQNGGEVPKLSAFDRRLALEYPEDCLVLEAAPFSTIFRPRYRGIALDLEDPRINEGLHLTLGALAEINHRARKAGVPFLVVGIPTKELVFEPAVRQANILDAPAGAHYVRLIENEKNIWERVREFLTKQEIAFVETLPYFRKQLDNGIPPFPASLNEHLNPSGHLAVAQCVHDWLSQNSLNPDWEGLQE